ncbi:MAG: efflux RND transporter periplasmic adaptor subunit [Gammaproteobacteria bacterium]|nr:MAG: efflux RND transporter periplasmic adaptor subunit [Gammaproteobacteria bacterium]
MSARVRMLAAALAILVGAVGWYLWRARGADDPNAALSLFGNVDVHQVELAFRVTGRIADMKVQEGDRVKAGDTLAQLDRVPFATDVAAAQADVEQARAQLAAAREQLNLELHGSRIEDIAAQQAALASAEARLAKVQTALSDPTLLAPSGGIISVRAREPGAIVQAGQTVYTLTLNDPVWIRAYVPQPRLGRIKPGMGVGVSIDSMPGKRYEATVGFISPDAEFTPKTVQTDQVRDDLVYRIRVIATDPDNVFRQGMPVTVLVPAARSEALARDH